MSTRFSLCTTRRPGKTLFLVGIGALRACIADAGDGLCVRGPDIDPIFAGTCLAFAAISDKAQGHQAPIDMKNRMQGRAKKRTVPRVLMRHLRVIFYGHQDM
jgi:hypothetical protein